MSHYFLCSQNKDSINNRFIQLLISDFVVADFFPKTPNPKPARIPPQTPPAGGKSAEAGRIHSPRQIVSPCRVLFSSFNHLDFARNSFELCPTNTAKIENRNRKQKCGQREAPSVLNSPQKILNLKGFATLRVAPRLPIQL
ncbi:MAG: hypothetical protein PHX50_16235 [Massilibacteroides sp.]|nr:hypothetical protein [Massilibacteroides sp.]